MPKFILSGGLLFWGWQTGWWYLALPMVLLYQAASFIPWRCQLSTRDFRQVSNFCTILLVAVLVYLLIAERSLLLIFVFFRWLPAICFPLLIAQTYAIADGIDLRALLFLKEKKTPKHYQPVFLDLTHPYLAICLVSASAANVRGVSFYLGMFVLSAMALWYVRSPRFSPWLWVCLIVLAGGMGMAGHVGLQYLQVKLERNAIVWLSKYYQPDIDPTQRTTAIGDIGSLKPSNRIVFRVKPAPEQLAPQLLRRATYNKYASSMWVAVDSEFKPLKAEPEQLNWQLKNGVGDRTIAISTYFNGDNNLLNLPHHSIRVENLPIDKMEQNQYGTVKINGEPGLYSYQVQYDNDRVESSPPTQNDLHIPTGERAAIDKIIAQLDLAEKSPQEILQRVNQFFQQFSYSLQLARPSKNKTPLSAFLLDNRSGHCEYFATATALLLRAVGIPTRYAIGYSVHEFSRLENQFIVRERNAHAWTLVYVDGVWQPFDTTPASWIGLENAAAPSWRFVFDIWSWFWFKTQLLIGQIRAIARLKYWWLLIVPLGFFVGKRFYHQQRSRQLQLEKITKSKVKQSFIGEDSEFYLIEKVLNQSGYKRDRTETYRQWLERLQDDLPAVYLSELRSLLELHYRYRFDPQRIKPTERNKLKSLSQTWLDEYQKFLDEQNKIGGSN